MIEGHSKKQKKKCLTQDKCQLFIKIDHLVYVQRKKMLKLAVLQKM